MKKLFVLAAVAAALSSASSASAATYLFSLSTSFGNGSGSFTTASDNAGFNLVTSLSGTFDGGAMTLLAPDSYPILFQNDNLFNAADPHFTVNGLGFRANGSNYKLFDLFSLGICGEGIPCRLGTVSSFSVTAAAVPEPASWALMIGGLAIAGAALRRRRTSVSFA
jgi:hypothetical protein